VSDLGTETPIETWAEDGYVLIKQDDDLITVPVEKLHLILTALKAQV
jgi:hypothetical protein